MNPPHWLHIATNNRPTVGHIKRREAASGPHSELCTPVDVTDALECGPHCRLGAENPTAVLLLHSQA